MALGKDGKLLKSNLNIYKSVKRDVSIYMEETFGLSQKHTKTNGHGIY
jgi:hypothetical protein